MQTETKTGLEWGELWSAMDAAQTEWHPTTEGMFLEMLECVPPLAMAGGAFLVGEATRHNEQGEAVYACFSSRFGLMARYMTLREFNAWKAFR